MLRSELSLNAGALNPRKEEKHKDGSCVFSALVSIWGSTCSDVGASYCTDFEILKSKMDDYDQ